MAHIEELKHEPLKLKKILMPDMAASSFFFKRCIGISKNCRSLEQKTLIRVHV